MKFLKFAAILLIALLLLSACGQSNQPGAANPPSGSSVSLKNAPADVEAIYKSNCMSCHAIDLSGKMGESTNLQQVHARLSYDEIAAKINAGGKTMPAFQDRLTVEEINALAAWLAKQ